MVLSVDVGYQGLQNAITEQEDERPCITVRQSRTKGQRPGRFGNTSNASVLCSTMTMQIAQAQDYSDRGVQSNHTGRAKHGHDALYRNMCLLFLLLLIEAAVCH